MNIVYFFSTYSFANSVISQVADFELLVRIITSGEFIFLGCLFPDWLSRMEAENDKKREDDRRESVEKRISNDEETGR